MLPIVHLGPFTFYTFGLVFGLAICIGTLTFSLYFKRHALPINLPLLAVTLIVSGFIGAKLDNPVLLQAIGHPHFFSAVRMQFLYGGYTYLGCLLAGMLATAVFVHINRLPWLRTFDSAFCIGIAYAVGRIGCFLAGDGDYGVASNLPWAMSFPHGIVPTLDRVHPTMLYSSAWESMLFAFLWLLSNPRRQPALRPGTLLGLYLVLTGVGRFLIETLSRNGRYAFGLTESQLVSAAFMVLGATLLVALHVRPRTSRVVARTFA